MGPVHNKITVGGSMTGPVIQSGGPVNVTGGIRVNAPGGLDRLADAVDQVRALLAKADDVPKRARTDACLSQIATEVRNPRPETPSVVGELWEDLLPELSALAGTVGAMKPHLTAITEGVSAL